MPDKSREQERVVFGSRDLSSTPSWDETTAPERSLSVETLDRMKKVLAAKPMKTAPPREAPTEDDDDAFEIEARLPPKRG